MLPSGGSLVIDRTEAMTVIDVNTGKFTGSGGNLEETVTRNNLEAAEEVIRQIRLRDIGGIIVVDFIDMVLESNRDLVLRRLTEALGRDRTKHQVSEVTSLGLVQMTRKRLGTGLIEAFSTTCTACHGRGVVVHAEPVEVRSDDSGSGASGKRKRKRKGEKAETPAVDSNKPHKPAADHPLFQALAHHEDEDGAKAAESSVEDASDDESTVTTESADTPADGEGGESRPRRRRRGGRGRRGAGTGDQAAEAETSENDAAETEAAETEAAEAETVEADEVPEADVVEETVVAVVETEATPEPAPEPEVSEPVVTTTRRRRTARRAAAPTAPAEPLEITVDHTPVTTVAEQSDEPVVEVKRSPRRRSTRRAAGAPAAE